MVTELTTLFSNKKKLKTYFQASCSASPVTLTNVGFHIFVSSATLQIRKKY